jgi:S-adenosylmethionine decarboxylase
MGMYKEGNTVKIIIEGCNLDEGLASIGVCSGFLHDMVSAIGMTAISDVHIVDYKHPDPKKQIDNGISAIIMIAESHIAIHSWPGYKAARIMIDSCKPVSSDAAISVVRRWFEPGQITISIVD